MTLTGELLIGAADVAATAGTMKALNPATGEVIEPEFAFGGAAEVDRAVRLADEAFDSYSHTGLAERAAFLDLVADKLEAVKDELAERTSLETGLPAAQFEGETGPDQIREVARAFRGQLSASVHAEASDHDTAVELLPILERRTGRIVINNFSMPQEVSHASVHTGPFPATSDSRFTSVGMTAIERFLRPVTYQNFPDELLPESLREANPLHVWRLVDGELTRD
ncbi:aldehyde dehydrogenase family protein [Streptomyces chiangmaiensis]|uniref:Aldehyde dehydrogenase family protein n=1 Tax=Streptomyces chiangmaiensis TaxID=766497 RepID=A0ABU7FRW6_9ACTN|nr:aldehyde dehydrogenase family protein [Streptomyces chiangmaiensis]MED7826842.1 aldehyde dehydrogenase family protein [Streptomyces chiangmaiensis]